jgi:hypothetical protein
MAILLSILFLDSGVLDGGVLGSGVDDLEFSLSSQTSLGTSARAPWTWCELETNTRCIEFGLLGGWRGLGRSIALTLGPQGSDVEPNWRVLLFLSLRGCSNIPNLDVRLSVEIRSDWCSLLCHEVLTALLVVLDVNSLCDDVKQVQSFLRAVGDRGLLWATCHPGCWVELPLHPRLSTLRKRQGLERVGNMVCFHYSSRSSRDVFCTLTGENLFRSPGTDFTTCDLDNNAVQLDAVVEGCLLTLDDTVVDLQFSERQSAAHPLSLDDTLGVEQVDAAHQIPGLECRHPIGGQKPHDVFFAVDGDTDLYMWLALEAELRGDVDHDDELIVGDNSDVDLVVALVLLVVFELVRVVEAKKCHTDIGSTMVDHDGVGVDVVVLLWVFL